MSAVLSKARADAATERLKVYAQPQRLMILSILKDGELTVSRIEELTGIGQPALSQQLAELRRADLVVTRRAARQVHYRLADEDVALCVKSVEAIFGSAAGARPSSPPPASPPPSSKAPPSRPKTYPHSAASFARIL
jgi:DNA-binding transcriptional ArsR family regulator